MQRQEVLRVLGEHSQELAKRFGVKSLRLFGSVARGEGSSDSDIDLLVDFDQSPSLFEFLELRSHLEDLLGRKVDLVTENGLKQRVRPYVERDAINVA
jgi:uncharacterized protein